MDINLNNFDKMLFEGSDCMVYDCLYNLAGVCTNSYNIQPINSKLPDNSKITCPSAVFKKEQIKEVELRCCPFCKSHAIRVQNPGTNWDGKQEHMNVGALYGLWYVGCPAPFYEGFVPDCEVSPAAKWYANLEDAEREWNRGEDA